MKKFILLLTILSVFASCRRAATHEEDAKVLDKDTVEVLGGVRITKFLYEGHEYLLYTDGAYKYSTAGFTHNPDCPCYERRDSTMGKK